MAWSWSHTHEAYCNARAQIEQSPRDWLEVCYAEIRVEVPDDGESQLDEGLYARALTQAKGLPSDVLADAIWEYASELQTCTNGGWEAWCCPWGCHTVPFAPVADEMLRVVFPVTFES